MTKILQKLLILLIFSVISVTAQDLAVDSDCNIKLSECLDKCADTDEACMDVCDSNFPCPEDNVEVSSES